MNDKNLVRGNFHLQSGGARHQWELNWAPGGKTVTGNHLFCCKETRFKSGGRVYFLLIAFLRWTAEVKKAQNMFFSTFHLERATSLQ